MPSNADCCFSAQLHVSALCVSRPISLISSASSVQNLMTLFILPLKLETPFVSVGAGIPTMAHTIFGSRLTPVPVKV